MNVNNVVVIGSYNDPRFSLNKTDVVCMNGNDGSISVTGLLNGRSPFSYTIIALLLWGWNNQLNWYF
jgi:hypothetical protein